METVQRRAMKMVGQLYDMPYEEKLSGCGLLFLSHLVEVFRIETGVEPLPVGYFSH